MAANALALKDAAPIDAPPAPTRDEIVARYRRLRELSKRHHCAAMSFVTRQAVFDQARRLGMVHGGTMVLDSPDELALPFDLLNYTSQGGRSRAIDRYARSTRLDAGSDEAMMLDAMRHARFSIWLVERRHETFGLVVTGILRNDEAWVVDEGLDRADCERSVLAMRLATPGPFAMTTGSALPIDKDIFEEVLADVPGLKRHTVAEAADDRRFAEAFYRVAHAHGLMAPQTEDD